MKSQLLRSPVGGISKACLWLAAGLLLPGAPARAQWQTVTYTLKGGWNAIYLHGDASYATPEQLFPSTGPTGNVLEVWRWNPDPNAIQFISSPQDPTPGVPEWSAWVRGGASNALWQMIGQAAYLVRCAGPSTNTYSISITQSPVAPKVSWVRNGANLIGLPTKANGATYPLLSTYFASFSAAIAPGTKIFKYIGGDLGPANTMQIFSPTSERVDRNTAYWFSADLTSTFHGPLEIAPVSGGGLFFGDSSSTRTVRIRNLTAADISVTLTPAGSETPPTGQPAIAGAVPLKKRAFNPATAQFEDTPIATSDTEVIPASSTVELTFVIDRGEPWMAAVAPGTLFGSLLRLTDSNNLMEVYLPVQAQKRSIAGLWVGDISVTNVSSNVSNSAAATATVTNGAVTAVTLSNSGGFGYTSAPTVTIAKPPSGENSATATATVTNGSVTAITVTNPGSGYAATSQRVPPPKVTIAPPPPLNGTSTPRAFPLRVILHVSESGTAKLLSQVFIGQLATMPHPVGLCTTESLLKQDAKATAQRLVAAHLPLERVIDGTGDTGSGAVAVPGVLVRKIVVPYNDPTNPFLHQYHPDHDNKDARFRDFALPPGVTSTNARISHGVEAPAITRTCTFTFTPAPPPGSGPINGWGSTVLGGNYTETIEGIHRDPIQVAGTFELRQASSIGTISTHP